MAILRVKLDVRKIDKDRLFQGSKGTYLDATILLRDDEDQYGQHGMIVQDVSKEERLAGEKGAILGNVTWAGTERPGAATAPPTNDPGSAYHAANAASNGSEDIPF
tara:strand:+ start:629 stop:946 length:318 start_codon:yes stop_codon:yes gene_type:complete